MVCESRLYVCCLTLPLLCTAIMVLYVEFAGTVASKCASVEGRFWLLYCPVVESVAYWQVKIMQVPVEEILASVLSGCRVSCLLAGENIASICGRDFGFCIIRL